MFMVKTLSTGENWAGVTLQNLPYEEEEHRTKSGVGNQEDDLGISQRYMVMARVWSIPLLCPIEYLIQ
jgi:hypothetical protein